MLTAEQNRLLTETSPGTPVGELLRRYWQPAALSEELPSDGAPLPVRLLGEDLALFRGDDGLPGLLGIHCAHRGTDLSYGPRQDRAAERLGTTDVAIIAARKMLIDAIGRSNMARTRRM